MSRHPWRYLVASLGVLLALAAPMLSMRLGQTDASTLNRPRSTLRRSYDLLGAGLRPGLQRSAASLAVDLRERDVGRR